MHQSLHLFALQGEEVDPVRAKAEAMGVKQIFIDDLREEFVKDYVFPMFRYAIELQFFHRISCVLYGSHVYF